MAADIGQQGVAHFQSGEVPYNKLLDNLPLLFSIGLPLCRTQNEVIAEYALHDVNKPLGISTYQMAEALPPEFKGQLPSVKELEGLGGREHGK